VREGDIEVILERAKEKYPEAKPRIISDNGPQFIARDFKEFIRISGTLLSPIERENRALAQIAKERVHPAGNTAFAGRCAASGTRLRRALQQRPLEQCHRLYHAEGYAGRTPAGDSGPPGSEIGSGERTPEESPPAGRVIDETDYFGWPTIRSKSVEREVQRQGVRLTLCRGFQWLILCSPNQKPQDSGGFAQR
jgi:hypothetical protein